MSKFSNGFKKLLSKILLYTGKALYNIGKFIKQPFNNKWGKLFAATVAVGVIVGTVAASVASGGAVAPVLVPIAIEVTTAVIGYLATKKAGAISGSVAAASTIGGANSATTASAAQYLTQALTSEVSTQATNQIIGGVIGGIGGLSAIKAANRLCQAYTGHSIDTVVGNSLITAGKLCKIAGQYINSTIPHKPRNSHLTTKSKHHATHNTRTNDMPSLNQSNNPISDIATDIMRDTQTATLSTIKKQLREYTTNNTAKTRSRNSTRLQENNNILQR